MLVIVTSRHKPRTEPVNTEPLQFSGTVVFHHSMYRFGRWPRIQIHGIKGSKNFAENADDRPVNVNEFEVG